MKLLYKRILTDNGWKYVRSSNKWENRQHPEIRIAFKAGKITVERQTVLLNADDIMTFLHSLKLKK